MKQRTISAIIFGLIFFPAIYFGGIYFLILSMFASFVGTFELMNMFYKKSPKLKTLRFIVPLMSVVITLFLCLANKNDSFYFLMKDSSLSVILNDNSTSLYFSYFALGFILYLLFILILFVINLFKKESTSQDLLSCVLALTYGGLMLASAFSLEYVSPIMVHLENKAIWGGQVFTYVYSVIVLTDMFAYFIGCAIGKHKLCPTISPKKSVEGAVGGLLVGSLVGTGIAYLTGCMPISSNSSTLDILLIVFMFLVISIIISVVEQLGDLVASKLKRSYEIKDYGNIMPGHGGIMDRFDSLILTGSLVYVLIMIVKFIMIGIVF